MIASVNGEVLVRRPDHVVVDANGVGYRLVVSAETLKSVPARGKRTSLHAHLVARGLNDTHFDAVVENLAATLAELGVGAAEIAEVAKIAESVRNDVLGRETVAA